METAFIIDLPYISFLNENLPTDFVKRDALLHQIEKILDQNDVVYIQGDEGVGKSTLLLDFVLQNSENSISHFVIKNYNFSYSYDCILDHIYKQVYFYCYGVECDENIIVNITLLNSIQSQLYKKIRQANFKKKNLYFVFDGFENLSISKLEILAPIFDNLPWVKAKFIFTGNNEIVGQIFKSKKLKFKEFSLINFSIHETKEYFKEFETTESQISEIHISAHKGLPATLKEIKLLCIDSGGVENFLNSDNISQNTDFFQKHWDKVDLEDKIQQDILSIIAYNDILLNIPSICDILNIDIDLFNSKIETLPFLDVNEDNIKYQTDTLKNFAKNKLIGQEDRVNSLLIEYFENHMDDDESKYNLPNLYRKAQQWEKLTKYFEIDTFIYVLEKYQTMGNLNTQFNYGFEASKKDSSKFDEARLRFALHKSSVKDIEKHQLWESEIEARIVLDDYDQALILANSALLKEDRLKLLATLAKQAKIRGLAESPDLISQIKDLYDQIDFSKIREKGFEIAGLLIYCDLELAISLVEKVSENSAGKNSLDYAYAYLTLYATQINKKSKSQIADIDVLNSKIQNLEVKNMTNALMFISDEYNFEQLISHVKNLNNFSQKLFLLKSWIINNKTKEDVHLAVKFTLEEIVKSSNENVPNATSLAEISIPLTYISNNDHLVELINLFDVHRNSINRPTKDYVRLQLNIAVALQKINIEKVEDRIFDIYLFIDDLDDLSVKTDCLSLLWLWLSKNDIDNSIENLLSQTNSIESQTRINVDLLLKDTAFHFKMVESIISTLVTDYPNFIFETIKKLNTEERRDVGNYLAVSEYIKNKEIEDIDFGIINKFYFQINNNSIREDIIIEVIDKFYNDKKRDPAYIPKLLPYYDLISKISKIANKCYVITHAIKILDFDLKYNLKIELLLKELLESWEGIDVQWEKIEIGYLIARDLADYSVDEAKKYLNFATELKNNEVFSSDTIAKTYINSIKLCIRAFCGLLLSRKEYDEELHKIYELINSLESTGEKLKLLSELTLRVYSMNKKDLFDKIFKDSINPLLSMWGKNLLDSYKSNTISLIAPAIYLYSQSLFFSDYLTSISEYHQNASIRNICDFILTNLVYDDPVDDKIIFQKLDYPAINELCILIEKSSNDYELSRYIEQIVKVIKENKTELPKEQFGTLKQKIKTIIDTKFPSIKGIQHEGYKIISEAELLTLDNYVPVKWDNLVLRAKLIPNLSDKALILIMLANKMNISSGKKKSKLVLMEEAFEAIKKIPSIYDKTNRFDATWETFLDIDRGKFLQYIKLAFQNLLTSKDGEIAGLRNLIDVAQQHDTSLAQEFVTMLDQDTARMKLKAPFLNRIENKNKVKNATEKIGAITTLDKNQFQEVSRKYIEGLNSGIRTSKEISETYEIIDKASKLSLNDSFESYMYFIQNVIKRFESNRKNAAILSSIFNATYENTKLICVLSSDNILKMKNLYKFNQNSEKGKNPIFSNGEQEEAYEYIKNWLSENIAERMYFIDPYFTEKDLKILQWLKEFNPTCQVTILTGKTKGSKNDHKRLDDINISSNKEVYINEWHKISSEPPVDTNIKIVWDVETYECPFHDRWYISGEANSCLYIGTSLNGLGNRDSQMTKFTKERELIVIKEKIEKYFFRKEKKTGKFNLKYEDFDLD